MGKLRWTPERLLELTAKLVSGATVAELGAEYNFKAASTLYQVLDRYDLRQFLKTYPKEVPPPKERPPNLKRGPLPAGSAESWGAITAGTILDGSPYPLPVLDHRSKAANRTDQVEALPTA